ncbi:MAG: RDD family protein [Clostridia bacterium]|nr:RDD family protein [Clostridia bacterium]
MKEKRIVAFIIDFFIVTTIYAIIALIVVLFEQLLTPVQTLNVRFIILPLIFFGEIYLALRDFICAGNSIGKRFVQIHLVTKTGLKPSWMCILLYDITIIIWPIEAFLLLCKGKTIGEYLSRLSVVNN